MKIGIVGAGIAGPCLAYWLQRAGHELTLIEQAPGFRTGGYVIDFWGVGYDVAERMGLIGAVRERSYAVDEVRLMKASGHAASTLSAEVFRRLTHGRYTSLARGDLAEVIFNSVRDKVETLFGESVVAVDNAGAHVDVLLSGGASRGFDLLVGADGLHSQVRQLVWGDQDGFERPLGYHVAAFSIEGYPYRDERIYVTYAEPGLSVSRFAMRKGRSVFLLVFADSLFALPEPHDTATRKSALRTVFGACGWETPGILHALDDTDEIYFDRVSQSCVPSWSKGRTVLLGDAAACPSLLAGEGAGLAMTEAYVLAGELHDARGDIPLALAAYETRLRSFVTDKQKSARAFASSFAPKTVFGIWLRNVATKLMVFPPIADLLVGASVKDALELPDYTI